MEKEANQLYRRPQMTGQAREEEELIDRPTKVNSEWPMIFMRL